MDRERRNRIGRNGPCHCGSGKKFKRCHGQILDAIPPLPPSVIPPEVMQRFMERHKADELRRESQQGLGKPIIGTKFKEYQLVAVGNRVHYGKWGTFYDFLGDYIRQVLTAEWGNSEIAKPLAERHPILTVVRRGLLAAAACPLRAGRGAQRAKSLIFQENWWAV